MLSRWSPRLLASLAAGLLVALPGCSSEKKGDSPDAAPVGVDADADTPAFSLAWSEYPSWSAFGVAESEGLIDGAAGSLGEMEQKWNVDVVLKQADYDPCLGLYADGQVDAVCITNIDILPLAGGRPAVVAFPTSTSVGGDAVLAVGVNDVAGLKAVDTRGLEATVSQYVFRRCLEERGENPADYPYKSMDPAEAARALQDSQIKSCCVWNPFLLSAERNTPNAKRLMDSSEIPEEVVDLVAIGKDSLAKPGGDRFAACLAETFHAFNTKLNADDDLKVALGERVGMKLNLDEMNTVMEQSRFYATAADAKALMTKAEFAEQTMPRVAEFTAAHTGEEAPAYGFEDDAAALNFTTKYLDLETAGPAK
ncbi:type 2 periplasmic-binding domain-containing protein [Alienimonas californiensis]|uniref:Alkanesulfonate transporter substrate-binding subunit n=1 Tax=Alienimonas californiensis TaxID=2527989 RepID=A0A517P883_9PLAN|nr:hypothetical protein [Alienimonas californiensis]QDT15591.1 hypothetical protein CA12_16760 [Alienimonas californiensis]